MTDHSRRAALSQGLHRRLCERLAGGPARRVATGEFVYLMGHAARSVYLVRSGLVKTGMVSPGGHELTLRLHGPGDVLGELCLCSGERRDEAVALETSVVVEVPVETLIGQLRRDSDAGLQFAIAVCEHLADAYERLRSLSLDPVMQRLVRTLLQLAEDLGQPTPAGAQITHYITQKELARLIGARREVVSGLLNRLRARGLVSYPRRGRISVNRDGLRALLAATSGT